MDQRDMRRIGRGLTTGEIAGRTSDPRFYNALSILPNPDTILRQLNYTHDVFDAIQADAHVIGELRSIRAGLLNYEYRVVKGDDSPQAARAAELCDSLLKRRPAPNMTWADTIWQMGTAVFHGQRIHEVEWQYDGSLLMPVAISDRPNRRFGYGPDNDLRVLTKEQPMQGIEAEPMRFLRTRHMPTYDNPYGVALFSSCFWPYTFKHSGFRWFVKFCERLGVPIPVGKYPPGTTEGVKNTMEQALIEMIESGYLMFEEGGNIDLLEAKGGSGQSLPQGELIKMCNREMSKALTSQTLATEQHDTGSRAASETHLKREMSVNESDRIWVADTFGELFSWITAVNVGPDVTPPTFEFYEESEARKERAEVYEIASRIAPERMSASEMLSELNIAEAKDDNDRVRPPQATPTPPAAPAPTFARSCPVHGDGHSFAAGDDPTTQAAATAAFSADEIIERDLIGPVADMLEQFAAEGRSLAEFQAALGTIYTDLDTAALEQLTENSIAVEFLRGSDEVAGEDEE